MKPIITKMLCSGILLLSFFTAFAESITYDGIVYNILSEDEKTVEVGKNNPSSIAGDITIPETINYNGSDYKVNSIGEYAFFMCESLKSIKIPSSVTSIELGAFQFCSSLTSLNIPASVVVIEDLVFNGCTSMTSINLPESLTSIEKFLFAACMSLTSISIPNSVTSIELSAFRDCSSLTSVTIPSSVTSIGNYAFGGCNSLTSVDIPESVKSIGESVFSNCTSLTKINVNERNLNFSSIEGVLYSKDKKTIIACPMTKTGEFILPDYVTTIVSGAFHGCSSLSSIDIPTSVTAIGELAFAGCKSLTAFELPNSITSISAGMFSGCSALKSIVIPNSVTSIDGTAFYDCSALSSIELPNSVNSIGNSAFSGCSSLSSITIPSSVSDIEQSAFNGCISLKEINVNEENQNYFSADGVLCSKKDATLVRCPTAKAGEFTIPSSVTSIGWRAFDDCSLLTSIVIPASVTSIDAMAFDRCGLKKIYSHSTQPFEFHDSFYNYDITVYVPTGYAAAYKAVAPWNKLNIIEMDYSGVNDINDESDFNVSVNDGAIVVNGIHGDLQVNVYDISGKKVYSGFSGYINGLKRGLYIVQVANKSMKVMLDQ